MSFSEGLDLPCMDSAFNENENEGSLVGEVARRFGVKQMAAVFIDIR